MSSEHAPLLRRIEQFARERCAGHDPAHDVLHVTRVVATARVIARREPAGDPFIVEAASWLHDIVQIPKGSGVPGEAARQSAREAGEFLTAIGLDPALVARITAAVGSHSFSGGLKPATIEAAIVQDADRLDALGAIGLARLWVTAGVLGSDLYHETDPAGSRRDLDDRTYGLDHIEAKLLSLPGLMNTNAGRELAQQRVMIVESFREQFLSELTGTP